MGFHNYHCYRIGKHFPAKTPTLLWIRFLSKSWVSDKIPCPFPDFKMLRLTKTKQSKTLPDVKISLDDRDSKIFYPKVSFDLFKLHKLSEARFLNLNDFFNS